jgi:hypothetical protein
VGRSLWRENGSVVCQTESLVTGLLSVRTVCILQIIKWKYIQHIQGLCQYSRKCPIISSSSYNGHCCPQSHFKSCWVQWEFLVISDSVVDDAGSRPTEFQDSQIVPGEMWRKYCQNSTEVFREVIWVSIKFWTRLNCITTGKVQGPTYVDIWRQQYGHYAGSRASELKAWCTSISSVHCSRSSPSTSHNRFQRARGKIDIYRLPWTTFPSGRMFTPSLPRRYRRWLSCDQLVLPLRVLHSYKRCYEVRETANRASLLCIHNRTVWWNDKWTQ